MSRFPKVTETFVLNEILQMRKLGVEVEVFPLMRENEEVTHPGVCDLEGTVHYSPSLDGKIIRANLRQLFSRPVCYLSTLWALVWGTLPSANFLAGAVLFFPKMIWMAAEIEGRGVLHVHAHFASHPALAAYAIHRMTGIPFSFTAHAHDIQVDTTMLKEKVSAASFVVAISETNRQLIRRVCGAVGCIEVIHCGVDTAREIAYGGRGGARLEILCVSSLIPAKGHFHLLEACALLALEGLDFRCRLVGEGPLRGEIRNRIVSLNLEKEVELMGAQPSTAVASLLRETDLFVMASIVTPRGKTEGIPVSLMEAMAVGLPVITTRVGSVAELVEDGRNGLLVEPGNPLALADAIRELALAPERRQEFGEAGRVKVREEFDLTENARRLLQRIKTSATEE